MGKTVADIGGAAVKYIRLPLLSPEELSTLETENKKDGFIPVSRTHAAASKHSAWHESIATGSHPTGISWVRLMTCYRNPMAWLVSHSNDDWIIWLSLSKGRHLILGLFLIAALKQPNMTLYTMVVIFCDVL